MQFLTKLGKPCKGCGVILTEENCYLSEANNKCKRCRADDRRKHPKTHAYERKKDSRALRALAREIGPSPIMQLLGQDRLDYWVRNPNAEDALRDLFREIFESLEIMPTLSLGTWTPLQQNHNRLYTFDLDMFHIVRSKASEIKLVIGSKEREERAITKVQAWSEFEDIFVEEDWLIPATVFNHILRFAQGKEQIRVVMKMSGEWKDYFDTFQLIKARYPQIEIVWVVMGPMIQRLETLGPVIGNRKFKLFIMNKRRYVHEMEETIESENT